MPDYVTPPKGIRVDQIQPGDQIHHRGDWLPVSASKIWGSSKYRVGAGEHAWRARHNDTINGRRPVCCCGGE